MYVSVCNLLLLFKVLCYKIIIVLHTKAYYQFFSLQALDASISLESILNCYHEGKIIIDSYLNNNKLNGLLRNKLSHIIITHLLKQNEDKKISTEKLISVSLEICSLFPQEHKETYYTPYKKEANLVSPARGKLWDKYNNLRKEIRKTNQRSTKEITPENYFIPSEGKV